VKKLKLKLKGKVKVKVKVKPSCCSSCNGESSTAKIK
jgi:hypothetical protein